MSNKNEFERIRLSFGKVKTDMQEISNLIATNTDNFFQKHQVLAEEVYKLTHGLRDELNNLKLNHKTNPTQKGIKYDSLKEEITFLKKNMNNVIQNNADVYNLLDRIKTNEVGIKELKKRLGTDELEIHLLKERLIEKDYEVKKMKEVNVHMLDVIDDLTQTEQEMLKPTIK